MNINGKYYIKLYTFNYINNMSTTDIKTTSTKNKQNKQNKGQQSATPLEFTQKKQNKSTTPKLQEKYKKNMSSDDEDDDDDDEENYQGSDNETDIMNEIDMKEYRSLLSELFPSKYMKEKAEKTPMTTPPTNLNKNPKTPATYLKHKDLDLLQTSKKNKSILKSSKQDNTKPLPPKKKSAKKELFPLDEDTDDYETYSDTDYSDEDEDEDYDEEEDEENMVTMNLLNKHDVPTKFNIIFTLGGGGEDEYYDEDDDDYDIDDDNGSEYDDDTEMNETDDEEETENKIISPKNNKSYGKCYDTKSHDKKAHDKKAHDKDVDNVDDVDDVDDNEFTNEEAFTKFNTMISSLSETEKKNPVIKEMIADIKKKEKEFKKVEEQKHKKTKNKNTKKFRTLLKEKNVMNDVKFFKESMTSEQQKIVIKEMEEIKKYSDVEKPYRLTLLEADIPTAFKSCAYKKINTLKYMEPGAGEYYKIKNWVDTFMQIPFNKYKNLPLTIEDGVEKCHNFMENAKQILDKAVYGLNDAKLQIMQMIGQLLVNPSSVGTAIAIKGPMGTGKTTLIKDGISKILGRDFAFIALGGATDSSFLEGHSYTYEGATWGKIVDIIIRCKSMNPVIYFDELDKVSDTPRGEEIIGILTHLTDTTQNDKFHDKYFAEIDFDLSRCLFIFSYNDESKVNPILRDRMYRIHTKGYDQPQKTTISNNYLLQTIRQQLKFSDSDIIIPDDTIHYIITNHTDKEDGVRNLKRCLEIIHTKLNLYRLMKPETNLFETDMSLKVTFPLTVTNEIVDKLIKKNTDTGAWAGMYS